LKRTLPWKLPLDVAFLHSATSVTNTSDDLAAEFIELQLFFFQYSVTPSHSVASLARPIARKGHVFAGDYIGKAAGGEARCPERVIRRASPAIVSPK
jgi:hypothetical protein